jgi:hypothetical protein
MFKSLAVASFAAFIVLGTPALSRADNDHGGDHGDNGEHGGGHHSAPEPITVIGLGLGAGGVAFARWAANRKRAR